jgi:hypothetical protein
VQRSLLWGRMSKLTKLSRWTCCNSRLSVCLSWKGILIFLCRASYRTYQHSAFLHPHSLLSVTSASTPSLQSTLFHIWTLYDRHPLPHNNPKLAAIMKNDAFSMSPRGEQQYNHIYDNDAFDDCECAVLVLLSSHVCTLTLVPSFFILP